MATRLRDRATKTGTKVAYKVIIRRDGKTYAPFSLIHQPVGKWLECEAPWRTPTTNQPLQMCSNGFHTALTQEDAEAWRRYVVDMNFNPSEVIDRYIDQYKKHALKYEVWECLISDNSENLEETDTLEYFTSKSVDDGSLSNFECRNTKKQCSRFLRLVRRVS